MNVGKFWLLMFLAVVIGTLVILEIICENQVANLTSLVSFNESRVTQARQQNEVLRQLIERIAIESQHDPALVDLLAKRGIHLPPRGLMDSNGLAPAPTSGISPATMPMSNPTPSHK